MKEVLELTEQHLIAAKEEAFSMLDALPKNLYYHSKNHTKNVFEAAMELCRDTTDQIRILTGIAAVFHDTGFLDQYLDNESKGAERAKNFMENSKLKFSVSQVQQVTEAIINTNMKSEPTSEVSRVLRDADLSSLGKKSFFEWSDLLRKEALEYKQSPLHLSAQNELSWNKAQKDFITKHKWFTEVAKKLYKQQFQANIDACN